MSIYQRIKDLINDKHISIAQIERDLQLSNGSMAKWDKHSPKSENIVAVAKYLNVSTDYLLGRDISKNKINPDKDVQTLQRMAEEYTPEQRKRAIKILELAMKYEEKNNNES